MQLIRIHSSKYSFGLSFYREGRTINQCGYGKIYIRFLTKQCQVYGLFVVIITMKIFKVRDILMQGLKDAF